MWDYKQGYKGARPKEYTDYPDFKRYYFEWKYKRMTKTRMAKGLNVSRPTLNKMIQKYEDGDTYW